MCNNRSVTSRTAEKGLTELAGGQWGLVTAHQAQAAGVSRTQLHRLVAVDVLDRVSQGVYVLRAFAGDDLLNLRAAWLALDPARLAADRLVDLTPTAVVSHASAAHLYGHGDLLADRHEFTMPTRKQTRRPEVRLHRSALAAVDVTLHRGLPVTTPARTVLDLLATHHDGEHVAAVLADAVRARLIDLAALAVRLAPFAARYGLPRGDGVATLEHLLGLGDVTAEVEADAIVASARRAGTTTSGYLAEMMSVGVMDQVNEVVRTALAANLTTILDQVLPMKLLPQMDIGQLLQVDIGQLLPQVDIGQLQVDIAQLLPQIDVGQLVPRDLGVNMRAAQTQLTSPAVQAQLEAARRATS